MCYPPLFSPSFSSSFPSPQISLSIFSSPILSYQECCLPDLVKCSLLCRQVMGAVLVLAGPILSDVVEENSACLVHEVPNSSSLHCLFSSNSSSSPEKVVSRDFTNALLLYMAVGTMALLLLVTLFRPKYRRLEMEQRAEGILQRLRGPEHNPPSLSSASPSSSFPHAHSGLVKASSPPTAAPMFRIKPEQCQTSTEL